jgi:hypothetical protein
MEISATPPGAAPRAKANPQPPKCKKRATANQKPPPANRAERNGAHGSHN